MSLTHTNQEFFNADTRMIHCPAQGYSIDNFSYGVPPGPRLLPMFEAALAGEISYGQNMSVPVRV